MWMDLEDAMLSDISQRKKNNTRSLSHEESKKIPNTNFIDTKNRLVFSRGGGLGFGERSELFSF